MEPTSLPSVVDAVILRSFVEIEASGRHVHLSRDQALALFGHPLTPKRPLSQPGQFLANERVTVIGPKGVFRNVAVLGPERGGGQVELSRTDCRQVGIDAPVRLSGDTAGSPGAVLESETGRVVLDEGVIVAKRHVHLRPQDAENFGVADGQAVRLRTYTGRPLEFGDVVVRVSPRFAPYVHLDYDEANACGLRPGDLGRLGPW